MIIKSRFKDYYDFVGMQFGGGDPRVCYARERLSADDYFDVEVDSFPLRNPNDYHPDGSYKDREKFEQVYLVVAGRLYLLSRPRTCEISHHNINSYHLKYWPAKAKEPTKKTKFWWRGDQSQMAFGVERPFLVDLCRAVRSPVLAVEAIAHGQVRIAGQCPILQEVGMASAIPAFQMYQEIAYFVGNTMKACPDTVPPVDVSNQEKILKAGFDLKSSFRHRM